MPACPTCGRDLTWIPQYDRYYCYSEKAYAPRGYGTPPGTGSAIQLGGAGTESHAGHHHCPSCGRELTYIPQYDRYYCFDEKKYAPRDVAPVGLDAIVVTVVDPPAATPTLDAETLPTEEDSRDVEPERTPNPEPSGVPAETPQLEPTPSAKETTAVLAEETPALAIPAADLRESPGATGGTLLGQAQEEDLGKRPALKRAKVRLAKKPQLEVWSKAHGLSTKGTRESLRNRLLQYMDDHHLPDREEVTIVEAALPAAAPSEPALVVPEDEPASELSEAKPVAEPPRQSTPEPIVAEPTPAAKPESERTPEPVAAAPPEPVPVPPAVSPPERVPEPAPSPAAEPLPALEPIREPRIPEPVPATEPQPQPAPVVMPETPRPTESAPRIPEAIQETVMRESPPSPQPVARDPEPVPQPLAPEPAPTPQPAEAPIERPARLSLPPSSPSTRTFGEPAPIPPRAASSSARMEPLSPTAPPAPPRAQEPPVTRVEVAKALPCPNCGRELTFISKYDRLYCFSCGRYAPKAYALEQRAAEAPKAPTASPIVAIAPSLEPPKPIVAPKPAVAAMPPPVRRPVEARPENVCPTCGRTMRYIKEYQRWWCDAERKYAPKRVKNPCPTCGKELSYIRSYERWYCPFEKKYAPKTYQASLPAAAERGPAPTGMAPPALRAKLAAAAAAVESTPAQAAVARAAHAHNAPGMAIPLAVAGFVVLIVGLPVFGILKVQGVVIGDQNTTDLVSVVLQLIGLALAMAGTALGFSSLRSRSE